MYQNELKVLRTYAYSDMINLKHIFFESLAT